MIFMGAKIWAQRPRGRSARVFWVLVGPLKPTRRGHFLQKGYFRSDQRRHIWQHSTRDYTVFGGDYTIFGGDYTGWMLEITQFSLRKSLIDWLVQRFNHVNLKELLSFYENVSTLHTSHFRALYGQTVKMMNENRLKDQRSYYVNFGRFAPSEQKSRYCARQPVRFGIIAAKC